MQTPYPFPLGSSTCLGRILHAIRFLLDLMSNPSGTLKSQCSMREFGSQAFLAVSDKLVPICVGKPRDCNPVEPIARGWRSRRSNVISHGRFDGMEGGPEFTHGTN